MLKEAKKKNMGEEKKGVYNCGLGGNVLEIVKRRKTIINWGREHVQSVIGYEIIISQSSSREMVVLNQEGLAGPIGPGRVGAESENHSRRKTNEYGS